MSTNGSRRKIGIATTGRADFGCLLPLVRAIGEEPSFDMSVYATGTHFSASHGNSVDEIISEGFGDQLVRVPCVLGDDRPQDMTTSSGDILQKFGDLFAKSAPEILVVLGDRFDLLPIVAASVPFGIPIAHLSGGEETTGAIDNVIRHAVSKLAHLHFPTQDVYAQRLIDMGEEAWRITVTGDPGLDILRDFPFMSRDALFAEFGFDPSRPLTAFTYHPETRRLGENRGAIETVLSAADNIDSQIVFTFPGADSDAAIVREAVKHYCAGRDDCRGYPHLGSRRYFNLLHHADCMVGNSSSGVIESASFALPVVDIGERQAGRLAAANVIRVPLDTPSIAAAWQKALSAEFRNSVAGITNPYGDGHASERIVERLKSVSLDRKLIDKNYGHLGTEPVGGYTETPEMARVKTARI